MNISPKFQETVINVWKEGGKIWLSEIPVLLEYFANKWQLQDLKPFDNLSYGYVLSGYSFHYKSPVVLKMMANKEELLNEQKALQHYNGNGCVKLLAFDLEKGALLLEAITPGASLSPFFPDNDDKATHIAIDVIRKLHSVPLAEADKYPSISNWLSLLDRFSHSLIPESSLKTAQKLSKTLFKSQGKLHLLHGDLHHGNILLKDNGEGIAIDPKGIIGESEYEIGAFLRNPFTRLLKQDCAQDIINQRVHIVANALKLDSQRILHWSYIQSVLAACWAIEDNLQNIQDFLDRIKLFEKIKML